VAGLSRDKRGHGLVIASNLKGSVVMWQPDQVSGRDLAVRNESSVSSACADSMNLYGIIG
jgi:hypothetical protein